MQHPTGLAYSVTSANDELRAVTTFYRIIPFGILAACCVTAVTLAVMFARTDHADHQTDDNLRIVSVKAPVGHSSPRSSSNRYNNTQPDESDWEAPERNSVLRALAMPTSAHVRVIVGADPQQQALCGEVRPTQDQPFRRFIYVKAANLATLDDGESDFAVTYDKLCKKYVYI